MLHHLNSHLTRQSIFFILASYNKGINKDIFNHSDCLFCPNCSFYLLLSGYTKHCYKPLCSATNVWITDACVFVCFKCFCMTPHCLLSEWLHFLVFIPSLKLQLQDLHSSLLVNQDLLLLQQLFYQILPN